LHRALRNHSMDGQRYRRERPWWIGMTTNQPQAEEAPLRCFFAPDTLQSRAAVCSLWTCESGARTSTSRITVLCMQICFWRRRHVNWRLPCCRNLWSGACTDAELAFKATSCRRQQDDTHAQRKSHGLVSVSWREEHDEGLSLLQLPLSYSIIFMSGRHSF
jgi:hypothetical protein